jgi:hypothetical protein
MLFFAIGVFLFYEQYFEKRKVENLKATFPSLGEKQGFNYGATLVSKISLLFEFPRNSLKACASSFLAPSLP